MKKLLKAGNTFYVQFGNSGADLGILLVTNPEDATPIPEEDAAVLQKHLKCKVVDVPPKWGIFYDYEMSADYTQKQQLVYYPVSDTSQYDAGFVAGFVAVSNMPEICKPIIFTNHNHAVIYASITKELIQNIDYCSVYVEKL
jgi:hypothetical protein